MRAREQSAIGFRRSRLHRKSVMSQGLIQSLLLQIVIGGFARPKTGSLAERKHQPRLARVILKQGLQTALSSRIVPGLKEGFHFLEASCQRNLARTVGCFS